MEPEGSLLPGLKYTMSSCPGESLTVTLMMQLTLYNTIMSNIQITRISYNYNSDYGCIVGRITLMLFLGLEQSSTKRLKL